MVCASSDTANLLTAPELTRLRASHPWVEFAGIVSWEDVVLAHITGGSELTLYPGLNIIGGVQPFAFSELMSGVFDIDPVLGIDPMPEDIGAILEDIGAMLDDIDPIPEDIGPVPDDIESRLDMGEAEVICIELSVDDIAIAVMSVDMLDALMSILFIIPIVLIEEVSEAMVLIEEASEDI